MGRELATYKQAQVINEKFGDAAQRPKITRVITSLFWQSSLPVGTRPNVTHMYYCYYCSFISFTSGDTYVFFLVFFTILRYVTYCRDLSQLLMELLKGSLRDYCTRPPPRELIDLSI